MKIMSILLFAVAMFMGSIHNAVAIDFRVAGQFVLGFGGISTQFDGPTGNDTFTAAQRLRLQIDAIASESLSGTVYFELGETGWGKSGADNIVGGGLGTDGMSVEVRRAYIDWVAPNSKLSFRMGLQGLELPYVAGGPALFSADVAAIVAAYRINDMFSVNAIWMRPYNDNYFGMTSHGNDANFLDNMDMFALVLPITGQNWKITPWVSVGMMGENTEVGITGASMNFPRYGLYPAASTRQTNDEFGYATILFAALPMQYTHNAWNFELDLNFGSVGTMGTSKSFMGNKDVSNTRQGWLAKALIEYKTSWGTPGVFAWYGSGDDGDVENGSEMMPYLSPWGNFTSFVGDLGYGWIMQQSGAFGFDLITNYSGSWGVGLQLEDVSIWDNITHDFRVTYWRGTNDEANVAYLADTRTMTNSYFASTMYMTTADYLVEFNVDTSWQIYENLECVLQLGYIINGTNQDVWKNVEQNNNGYKAAVMFNYTF